MRKDLYNRHKLRHERQLQQFGHGRLTQRSSLSQGEGSKRLKKRPGHSSFSEEDGSAWSDTQDEARETPLRGRRSRGRGQSLRDDRVQSRDRTQADEVDANVEEPLQSENDLGDDGRESGNELPRRMDPPSQRPSDPQAEQPMGNTGIQFTMTDLSMTTASPGIFNQPDQAQNGSFGMQSVVPGTTGVQLGEEHPFGLSPSSTDEFTSWLFNGQGINQGYSLASGNAIGMSGLANNFGQLCPDYSTQPELAGGSFAGPMDVWFQSETISMPAAEEDLTYLGNKRISEQKRQSLLQYMMQRFNEIGSQWGKSAADIKNEIFGSDTDTESHVLSHDNVERYITSYWENFHDQLPILHRPTFVPEKAHDFLLMAVLIMGASMVAKKDGLSDVTGKISKFTSFVSWNLRWQVFMHADSHPPAKLWVIQTLLILEVYEKMNATRMLHERAQIYFSTTLSLMRRGSALTGKQSSYASQVPSPLLSPRLGPSLRLPPIEEHRQADSTPERWWHHWVAQEATRRAAFAAFILDATHAALFGHTPTLVIHEIKLPLPCDNTLWSSDSPSEIGSVESSLHANGVTPMPFLEGLRKTLNGQKVHTSPFGRIALLAALLSVTWQMHQRDLDRSTLGTDTIPGVQERWRPKLLRAFDWWKRDYEDGIAHIRHAAFDWQKLGLSQRGGSDDGDAFQTLGTILYHIGSITVHISMPELCIFVGVKQILGRSVTPLDRRRTEAKMKEWAASPGALSGVYHALELVKLILLGQDDARLGRLRRRHSQLSGVLIAGFTDPGFPEYSARNDNLLTRAWALYYAALVLWAYGLVQDGALEPYPENLQYPGDGLLLGAPGGQGNAVEAATGNPISDAALDERVKDLRDYMRMMIPPEVDSAKAFHLYQHQGLAFGRRNRVIGLLSVVDAALEGTSWELLSEARHRLKMAAAWLKPSASLEG